MLIRDKATISTRKKLPDGSLLVDVVLARTGIQLYTAGELGVTDRAPHEMIRVWRPASEVFHPDAMASFAGVAVTNNHPADYVTDANAKDLAIGHLSDTVTRDGDNLVSKATLTRADGIAALEGGKEEVSNGYDSDMEWTPGVIPAGERDAGQHYDCIQRTIRGNHVALVDAGRCGPECRVKDSAPKQTDKASCNCHGDEAMKKILVDGLGFVEVNDEADAAITKLLADNVALQAKVGAADGAAAALNLAHADAVKKLNDEIADLKAQIADSSTLDARANARAKLIGDAKRLAGDDLVTDGKSDLEIRKAAVTKKLGDEAVKDRPDSFFDGAFDTLLIAAPAVTGQQLDDSRADPLADALRKQRTDDKAPSYEDRMAARWKGKAA